jgi:hypothetical protein
MKIFVNLLRPAWGRRRFIFAAIFLLFVGCAAFFLYRGAGREASAMPPVELEGVVVSVTKSSRSSNLTSYSYDAVVADGTVVTVINTTERKVGEKVRLYQYPTREAGRYDYSSR